MFEKEVSFVGIWFANPAKDYYTTYTSAFRNIISSHLNEETTQQGNKQRQSLTMKQLLPVSPPEWGKVDRVSPFVTVLMLRKFDFFFNCTANEFLT